VCKGIENSFFRLKYNNPPIINIFLMIIFKKVAELQQWLANKPISGNVGFVPTMGALHQGHLSLIAASKQQQAITVASVFVNPTQFNDVSDFTKYPITIAEDIKLLEAVGCDVLFLPDVTEIYPDGTQHLPHYDLGDLENKLEGFYRPGHFQGVCQVVHRLLQIVSPDHLYMGQKDYQQCMVVRKLIKLTDLPIQLHVVETKRETAGLAMSSRNIRLDETAKSQALSIYRQMSFIQNNTRHFTPNELKQKASENLLADGFSKVDYIEIADPIMLEPISQWQQGQKAVVLVAAFLNEVRLIDNLTFTQLA
jgi:pantoate--beta-alanine ligase